MKAVRFFGAHDVKIVPDVSKPTPRGEEVLIRIGAAGVCHSDLHIIDGAVPIPGPFTLGHENAGWIVEMGPAVSGYKKGDAVLVYGPWGCGHCKPCQKSAENYCDHQAEKAFGGGLGIDGGMADYMLVPSARLLVPIFDLDPVKAAPLTDAALTPYSAVMQSLDKLNGDEFVVVIGIGGLGHVAIQILKNVCSATIIACDVSPDKLELAKKHGAQHTVNSADKDAVERINKITGVKKAKVVFDFVGIQPTLQLGAQVVGLDGDFTVVGLGGGHLDWSPMALPLGVSLKTPYWGTRAELMEVVGMARQGKLNIEVEKYKMEEALQVYKKLEQGQIKGRAVLVP